MSSCRTAFASLLTIGLLVSLNAPEVSAGKIKVSKRTASAGKVVKVSVKAGSEGFSTVGSTSFELSYDTTHLDVLSVNDGGVLSNFASSIDEATGKIKAGSVSLSGDNIPGKATIFKIKFAVDENAPRGKIPVNLTHADLTDTTLPAPNPIHTKVVSGAITVKN
jgi:hypothetical protein